MKREEVQYEHVGIMPVGIGVPIAYLALSVIVDEEEGKGTYETVRVDLGRF